MMMMLRAQHPCVVRNPFWEGKKILASRAPSTARRCVRPLAPCQLSLSFAHGCVLRGINSFEKNSSNSLCCTFEWRLCFHTCISSLLLHCEHMDLLEPEGRGRSKSCGQKLGHKSRGSKRSRSRSASSSSSSSSSSTSSSSSSSVSSSRSSSSDASSSLMVCDWKYCCGWLRPSLWEGLGGWLGGDGSVLFFGCTVATWRGLGGRGEFKQLYANKCPLSSLCVLGLCRRVSGGGMVASRPQPRRRRRSVPCADSNPNPNTNTNTNTNTSTSPSTNTSTNRSINTNTRTHTHTHANANTNTSVNTNTCMNTGMNTGMTWTAQASVGRGWTVTVPAQVTAVLVLVLTAGAWAGRVPAPLLPPKLPPLLGCNAKARRELLVVRMSVPARQVLVAQVVVAQVVVVPVHRKALNESWSPCPRRSGRRSKNKCGRRWTPTRAEYGTVQSPRAPLHLLFCCCPAKFIPCPSPLPLPHLPALRGPCSPHWPN